MRHSCRLLTAVGCLTLGAALLGGCSSTTQVADYNPTFAPTRINPEAYDVLIAAAVYRPSSGLALGAGDRFGDINHQEYVAYVNRELDSGRYAGVDASVGRE
jgi:hypothetical protein